VSGVGLVLLTLLPGCYLGHVAAGQLRLLRARTPISQALADPVTSDDERERLALVLEARDYARSLGLEVGEQYTSYAPWPGDRLVTAVVATPPGTLEPAGFWFPLVGRVPYKSYFNVAAAETEAEKLRERGLDVCLSPVPAYSTLGWMADPVTGPLLRAPRTDLVATVLHELLHATVYVSGDADFNEGLATFVGEEAALRFFAARDGPAADTARTARARVGDERAISAELLALRTAVAALYAAEPRGSGRAAQRARLEAATRARVAALPLATVDAAVVADRLRGNDACLALEGTYTADLMRYQAALARFDGDLRALVAAARTAAKAKDPRAALLGP
jgi:predicted aminopeptidase